MAARFTPRRHWPSRSGPPGYSPREHERKKNQRQAFLLTADCRPRTYGERRTLPGQAPRNYHSTPCGACQVVFCFRPLRLDRERAKSTPQRRKAIFPPSEMHKAFKSGKIGA